MESPAITVLIAYSYTGRSGLGCRPSGSGHLELRAWGVAFRV